MHQRIDPGSDAYSIPASGRQFSSSQDIRSSALIDDRSCKSQLRSRIVKIEPKIQTPFCQTDLNLRPDGKILTHKRWPGSIEIQKSTTNKPQDKQKRVRYWQQLKLWSRRCQKESQIQPASQEQERSEGKSKKETARSLLEKVTLERSRQQLTQKIKLSSVSRTSLDRQTKLMMKEAQTQRYFSLKRQGQGQKKEMNGSTSRNVNKYQKCLRKSGSLDLVEIVSKSPVRFRVEHLKPLIQKNECICSKEKVSLDRLVQVYHR